MTTGKFALKLTAVTIAFLGSVSFTLATQETPGASARKFWQDKDKTPSEKKAEVATAPKHKTRWRHGKKEVWNPEKKDWEVSTAAAPAVKTDKKPSYSGPVNKYEPSEAASTEKSPHEMWSEKTNKAEAAKPEGAAPTTMAETKMVPQPEPRERQMVQVEGKNQD